MKRSLVLFLILFLLVACTQTEAAPTATNTTVLQPSAEGTKPATSESTAPDATATSQSLCEIRNGTFEFDYALEDPAFLAANGIDTPSSTGFSGTPLALDVGHRFQFINTSSRWKRYVVLFCLQNEADCKIVRQGSNKYVGLDVNGMERLTPFDVTTQRFSTNINFWPDVGNFEVEFN